jgi:hypothetical protein|mmetsp:Transcript_46572/g.74450  ORF Transcript_46572/g.74450 Transcript_46572/m.74450 type:complete len:91 (+) Transcript_46572:117-389(+)
MGKNAKKPRMAAAPVPMPAAPVHVVPASEALSAIANLAATVKGCKKSDSLFAKIAAKKQVPTSEVSPTPAHNTANLTRYTLYHAPYNQNP